VGALPNVASQRPDSNHETRRQEYAKALTLAMSESGTQRTCRDEAPMSAFGGKADIENENEEWIGLGYISIAPTDDF
jgi:hypothetical protein